MLDRERHALILRVLRQGRFARVAELAELAGSSEATLRRDLTRLERQGYLRRVRGGAELLQAGADGAPRTPLPPFEERRSVRLEVKRRIARAAAALCREGETVMVDGGSTTYQMAQFLETSRLQIITNSFAMAGELVRHSQNAVILSGGMVHRDSQLVLDPMENAIFKGYYASRAFMGVYGIDELGATNTDLLVIQAERAMIENARELVILADSSKFGRRGTLKLCELDRIHTIITDREITDEQRGLVESRGVRLMAV